MSVTQNLSKACLGGALAMGAIAGLSEALGLLGLGRLWIQRPASLLVSGTVVVALASLPAAVIAPERSVRGGIGAAALFLLGVAGALAVVTDPPPFQEPPWYSGSILAALGLVGVLAGLWFAMRRLPVLAWSGLAVAPVFAMSHRDSLPEVGPGGGGDNLLIVTLDTTRADHMSAYGYERPTSPHFDALAAQGALFEAAIAPIAVTGPSHTSLMTGSGTWDHDTLLNGIPMPRDRQTLAQSLRAQGYSTGAFVSAYVLDGKYGFSQGFEVYDDDFSALPGWERLLPGRVQAAARRRMSPNQVLERRGDLTVDQAISWLEKQQGPWMLWVHLFDAHGPYTPPPPYDTLYYAGDPRDPAHDSMAQVQNVAPYLERSLEGVRDVDWVVAQYDAEITFADAQLGRLLDAVGPGEDTLVLISADHGESLGEHGVWFNHGDDLFDASTHIPVAMRYPGHIEPGTRVSGLVEISDLAPTVYELLEVPAPESVAGDSLAGSWEGRSVARGLAYDREANLAARELDPTQRPTLRLVGLRSQDSLFVRRESEAFGDALYRWEADPAGEVQGMEQTQPTCALCPVTDRDQAALFPMEVQALSQQADALLSGDAARSGAELSPEDRAMLEALGYME